MDRIVGIENELWLYQGKKRKNFSDIIERVIGFHKKQTFEFLTKGYCLWTGGIMYSDGFAAEVTSAAAELRDGCVTEAVDSLFAARTILFEGLKHYNEDGHSPVRPEAYSGHYNFSSRATEYSNLESTIRESVGLPYMLLIENRLSSGIMVRDKTHRVEICGEYLPSYEQNIAAMAFMLGTIEAIRCEKELKLPFKIIFKKGEHDNYTYCDTIWPSTYGSKQFLKKGRDATVNVMLQSGKKSKIKAQKVFEEYFYFFKERIQRTASKEISLLEEFVKGNKALDIDNEGLPPSYKPAELTKEVKAEPRGLGALYARAARNNESVGGIRIKTKEISWDDISFIVETEKEPELTIKRNGLAEFYSEMDKVNASKQGNNELLKEFLKKVTEISQASFCRNWHWEE